MMTNRVLFTFAAMCLASAAAHAEPCVKIRSGEASQSCMKFSAEERKQAAALGLRLGAPYAQVRQQLAKAGWSLDQKWIGEHLMEAPADNGLVCGSGWDAVCTTAFRKNRQIISLVLSGTNDGAPLIGVETEAAP